MSAGHFDVLLRGGEIADGTGAPLAAGDVGIAAGRVRLLAPGTAATADRVVDVSGQIVAPGFIDAHTHSDETTLNGTGHEQAHAAVLQGVTVEVCGNCGDSAFPGPYPDFAAFAGAHASVGRANHLVSLVGHGTLRAAVVGHAARAATAAELAEMCQVLDRNFTAGAAGLSTGLIYTPGSYADTAEVTALATVAARHRKPYVTHLRDEMSRVEEALDEAVAIARASGAALHVSHHKTAGKYAWGGTERTLPRLERLRAEGMDLTCDVYPYTAASTALSAMLPPWAHDGGPARLLERLRDAGQRARMREAIAEGVPGWENTVGNGGWDRISVAGAARHRDLQGRTIAAIAEERGADAVDVAAELLLAEDGDVTIISHSMREDDVQRVLSASFSMIGSDGVPKPGLPHPRWAGTFARVLGHYARDLQLLSIPEAVHKMTGATAERFGLAERGVLRDGAHADLVVFDPATVADRATFTEPLQAPVGIRMVLVAGAIVVRDGTVTGERPGQVLAC
ncbi:N-acyl-D-amino-acid deacylase family protein [Streptomyces colonosanans]|uniref:N-acyl-D-amino-acid deacylase n=1 Tax=Streptomyces colonosanans TaxID=1428652 RepID=A0A1S2PLC6_9ACTN|nr:D-aminoacylase [Streptomyces colonosanans]OIJ94591.1 N-acyl-D-amino-acid deacylase [Streptomyces colonosanans]